MPKNYKARWVKRPSGPRPDSVVGTGRLLSSFSSKSLVKKAYSFEAGEVLEFAQFAISADGGYVRVMKTSCWMPLNIFGDVTTESMESKTFIDSQKKFVEKLVLNATGRSATLVSVAADLETPLPQKKTVKINPKPVPYQGGRTKHMDKRELKTLITDLGKTHIGEEIEVTFRSNSKNTSGKYRLLEVKRGRGKGASMIARVESVVNGHTMSFGTPNSDEILNIKWRDSNGEAKLEGYADESEVPTEFSHDATNALALKNDFIALIGKTNIPVTVNSTEPSFAGTHMLTSAKKMAGRFGQVKLELSREDGTKFEIWSYRHSGIVKSIS